MNYRQVLDEVQPQAARFFIVGGVNTNWGDTSNWASTSGGSGGQTVPTASDAVTLDASSGSACVINASARVCASFTSAAFTGTVTFDQQLSVSGSITIGAGQAFSGAVTNKLRMIAAGTWDSNGVTIPQNVEIGGSTAFTCTLAEALTISGSLTLSNTVSTTFSGAFDLFADSCVISGSQTVTLVNDITITGLTESADANVVNGAFNWRTGGLKTTGGLRGTSTIRFVGTGTWIGAMGYLENDVVIETSGRLSLSGTILYKTGSIVWISGVVSAGTSTLSIGGSCALETRGMAWNNITVTATATITINSALLATGTFTGPEAATVTFAGSYGFDFGTVAGVATVGTRQYVFQSGVTYTVRTVPSSLFAGAQTVRLNLTASGSTVVTVLQRGAG